MARLWYLDHLKYANWVKFKACEADGGVKEEKIKLCLVLCLLGDVRCKLEGAEEDGKVNQ